MTVKWSKVNIQLGQGIDTKTDSKALPPTKLAILENGVFTKKIAIKKRNGSIALNDETTDGATITTAKAVGVRGQELLLFDGDNVYSYADGPAKWVDQGSLLSIGVIQKSAAYTTSDQTSADSSDTDGLTVYAWEDGRGGVRMSAVDSTTGAVLIHDYEVSATGVRPRCVAMAGYIHILYVETSTTSLMNKRISSATPVTSIAGSPIIVVNDIDSSAPNFDIKPYGTVGAFTYWTTGGFTKLAFLASNGAIGSPGNGGHANVTTYDLASDGGCSLAVNAADGSIVVGAVSTASGIYAFSTDYNLQRLDTSLAPEVSVTAADYLATNITCAFESTARDDGEYRCQFFFETPANDNWNHYVQSQSVYMNGAALALDDGPTAWRHTGLASHAFDNGGSVYVNLVHDSPQQSTYFTTRYDGKLAGKYLPGIAGGLVSNSNLPSITTAGSQHSWSGTFKNRLEVDVGQGNTYSEKGIKNFTLDFDSAQSHRSVEVGNATYVTGGFLQMYDGSSPVESGFHLYPENVSAVPSNTTSGTLTSTETYNYQCYWEWYNKNGERELSATASGTSVTMGGSDDTVTLTVPTLSLTDKKPGTRSGIRLAVTRTEGNGTTRYRVDNPAAPTWNNPSVDTITFIDTMSDVALTTKELDYTNAEFDHTAPPSAEIITATKDRVFLAGFEDPNLIRYSKVRNWGTAVAFHDGFQVLVDREGGDITGLGSIDDKVIIFKERRIFVFTGDGPDNAGVSGDSFPIPQLVTSDVGCSNQRSIVQMPLGLMFQSAKGIYLLDRNLQLLYIGADVEDFNSQTITAATLLSDRNLVIFLCASGKSLVFDYHFSQWSTFTNHTGTDAVLWEGVYVHSRSDGEIRKETIGSYKDNNEAIVLALETGWLSFESMQGFARVRRAYILGEYKSEHTLKTRIAYDYENYFAKTITWSPSDVLDTGIYGIGTVFGDEVTFGSGSGLFGGSASSVYQVRIQMPRQKCESVKFRFEDIPGSDPGESFELNQLTLEVGLKGTPFKLPANKTIGD